VDGFRIDTYKDKNYPFPEDARQPTVRDFIKNVPFYLKLDTIDLQQGQVNVELLAEDGEEPAKIFFENLQAKAFNISNDSMLFRNGSELKLQASTNIMGEALLKAAFTFDMQDKDGNYVYTAQLGSMDMQHFNQLLEPIAYVKVRSGKIDTVNWRVEANKYYAIGSMDFFYDKLRISILDRDADTRGMDKGLASFFANTFIVNTSNPYLFIIREGDIYAERDVRKAIFDHWAMSSLSGIVSSIGSGKTKKKLKQAQHEALKEQIQALKEKQENKENE
jgi:hypothetical protein